MHTPFAFCPDCGRPTRIAIPADDNRQRAICDACDKIFYQNPRNVVGCIVAQDDQVLLCKRAIEPRQDFWTLPGGYHEIGETPAAGALRETFEEAQATAKIDGLFCLLNVPEVGLVNLFYRAHLVEPHYGPGPESTAVEFMREQDIPWSQLAFPTMYYVLKRYFEDYKRQHFGLHEATIGHQDWRAMGLAQTPAD